MYSVIWNQHVHMSVCSFWGREREKMRGREKNRQTEKKNFEQE